MPTSDVDGNEADDDDLDIWSSVFSTAFSRGAATGMLLSVTESTFGLGGSGSVVAGGLVVW